MHRKQTSLELRQAIFDYASNRMDYDPAPLDGPKSFAELTKLAGQTISEDGLGGYAMLDLFATVLAPATISTDHPNYLSFIPAAPTELSTLFDLVVSASSIYGGSWLEGAGAVYAENQVLDLLASECGFPASAGGVFVQGGTLGNLSALVTARDEAKRKFGRQNFAIIASSESHSSLIAVAKVMDVEIVMATASEEGRIDGIAAEAAIGEATALGLFPFCLVGTAGTTNFGIIDELESLAELAIQHGLWFHVDGAYGLAGILVPELKEMYRGIEKADSFIVDPHKWLFAPFDACALVYKNPALARQAHTQHGDYLAILNQSGDFNPSDHAINLTRRVRGLPLWFSLASHGVATYRQAIRQNVVLARKVANVINEMENLKLVRTPQLSVVVFERIGWNHADYSRWSANLLHDQFAFVVPSSHNGKPNARFAFVNPATRFEDLLKILQSME